MCQKPSEQSIRLDDDLAQAPTRTRSSAGNASGQLPRTSEPWLCYVTTGLFRSLMINPLTVWQSPVWQSRIINT